MSDQDDYTTRPAAPATPPVVAAQSLDEATRRLPRTRFEHLNADRGLIDPSLVGDDLRDEVVRNARVAVNAADVRVRRWYWRKINLEQPQHDGLTDEEDLVNREIARAYKDNPKVRKVLGQVYVERQEDLAAAVAETNLGQLLECFRKPIRPGANLDADEREAYEAVRTRLLAAKQRLGLAPDAPFGDAEINALMTSDDLDDRDAGMALLSAASRVCKRPRAIDLALEDGSIAPIRHGLTGPTPLDTMETSIAYIKALRAKITNVAFRTQVERRMQDAARGILKNPADIAKYIACVGFNRVMSPNNLLGASLASDIDFKLVLDDVLLGAALEAEEPLTAMDDELIRAKKARVAAKIDQLRAAMYQELKVMEGVFEQQLDLTLEVQQFALKGIRLLKKQLLEVEPEKMFLATAFENQVLMSGNPEVQTVFNRMIRRLLVTRPTSDDAEPGLPLRVFNQYLGESDKGSIRTVAHLTKLRAAFAKLTQTLLDDPEALALAAAKLGVSTEEAKRRLTHLADLTEALDDPALVTRLKPHIDAFADDVDLFKDKSGVSRLKLLAKNVKAFSAGDLRFVGEADANADNWVFSNKYTGCRINDFFDATNLQRYRAWKGVLDTDLPGDERPTQLAPGVPDALEAKYRNGKHVAQGVNVFAIHLQMLVYYKYMNAGLGHAEIDKLYDKLTADQLVELFEVPEARAYFRRAVAGLVAQLEDLEAAVPTEGSPDVDAYRPKVKAQLAALKAAATALDADPPADPAARARHVKQLGLRVMTAVHGLTTATAELIDPRVTPAPLAPQHRKATPAPGDGRTRAKTSRAADQVTTAATVSHKQTRAQKKQAPPRPTAASNKGGRK